MPDGGQCAIRARAKGKPQIVRGHAVSMRGSADVRDDERVLMLPRGHSRPLWCTHPRTGLDRLQLRRGSSHGSVQKQIPRPRMGRAPQEHVNGQDARTHTRR
eukprot:scaffold87932_cov29-Tisochrysis_lutea.AAC.2